ncbi:MAG: group 1 truncated hemoglobin, partial [Chloroflexi bacterium]|nr:group 1 truncated hemoglobin [Chloroflexota bacterium]
MNETKVATTTLYERLGGPGTIAAIASDLVDAHLVNPLVGSRFQKIDEDTAKRHAFEFFCMGSGGPESYTGRDLRDVHTGMNVSEQEFLAAVDDLMMVLDRHGIDEREKQEVL